MSLTSILVSPVTAVVCSVSTILSCRYFNLSLLKVAILYTLVVFGSAVVMGLLMTEFKKNPIKSVCFFIPVMIAVSNIFFYWGSLVLIALFVHPPV